MKKNKTVKEEVEKPEKVKDGEEEKENHGSSEDETGDGSSSNTDCDQESDISFMSDTDEEIGTADIEEEESIECVKRSTEVAIERMKTAQNQCWVKTHRRMEWRLAMRQSFLPEERWVRKAAEWNPELSTAVGRPKKRWEDEFNDFFRRERTKDETSNVEINISERIKTAKIKMVGTKSKTSSQWRQQQLPAQGTGAEGERSTVYDTCRRYDSVGTDANQCIQYSDRGTGEKYGENLSTS